MPFHWCVHAQHNVSSLPLQSLEDDKNQPSTASLVFSEFATWSGLKTLFLLLRYFFKACTCVWDRERNREVVKLAFCCYAMVWS